VRWYRFFVFLFSFVVLYFLSFSINNAVELERSKLEVKRLEYFNDLVKSINHTCRKYLYNIKFSSDDLYEQAISQCIIDYVSELDMYKRRD
jgi:hypothetical protein